MFKSFFIEYNYNMRVEFNNLGYTNNQTTFTGARARKLIEKINCSEKMDKLKITFEELKSMYKEIGYDVLYKRGSHAIVPINEELNIPVVIPHKKNNVHPFDLKRFKYILLGDFEKAKECR